MDFVQQITQWDFSVLYCIQDNLRFPAADAVAPWLSYLFEYGLLWIVLAAVLFFFRRTRLWGVMIGAAMVLVLIVGELCIKNIVCRLRPCDIADSVGLLIPRPASYSFPSGHTATAFSAATVLFFCNKRAGAVAAVVAVAVALSRMYLFVHFPTDVIAGALLGIILGCITAVVFRRLSPRLKLLQTAKTSDG